MTGAIGPLKLLGSTHGHGHTSLQYSAAVLPKPFDRRFERFGHREKKVAIESEPGL